MKRSDFLLLLGPGIFTTGCGYHVSGRADLVPKNVKTIAIPAFENFTTRYKLTERLPFALSHEFITRTRYLVVPDPEQADAVLKGTVTNYLSFPTISDQTAGAAAAQQATGRTIGVQMSVFLNLSLRERESGKVIYSRQGFEAKQRYEISTDNVAYFEESDIGLVRLSNDVARTVVTSILEAF